MAADLEAQLRERSLRVTGPRLAVLRAVHENPHADTDTLIGAVRASAGRSPTRRCTTSCAC